MTQGFVTVGDSTEYRNNAKCAVVDGQGYYSCSTPLQGRYIAYYSTQFNTYGLFVASFKVWGSENLVAKASIGYIGYDVDNYSMDETTAAIETKLKKMDNR